MNGKSTFAERLSVRFGLAIHADADDEHVEYEQQHRRDAHARDDHQRQVAGPEQCGLAARLRRPNGSWRPRRGAIRVAHYTITQQYEDVIDSRRIAQLFGATIQ